MTTPAVGDHLDDDTGHDAGKFSSHHHTAVYTRNDALTRLLRVLAGTSIAAVFLYLINSYLTFWLEWPGVPNFFADRQWLGLEPLRTPLEAPAVTLGWVQLLLYPAALALVVGYVIKTPGTSLRAESARISAISSFIIRGAFYAVLLIGITDWAISAVRVEGALNHLVGQSVVDQLGRPTFRGIYIHYPLLAVGFIIAAFTRNLGFPWLALLIVVAEIQIVLTRFVFSYEQAYMGDLVRFWYAALFLFASAYALPNEGHVRVDVFYARFSRKGQARTNSIGSVVLGLPICWVILIAGIWDKGNPLISPLTNYEISQAGFGMYTKYLMAGYLIIFAVAMAVQFTSYFLSAMADLREEPDRPDADRQDQPARAEA